MTEQKKKGGCAAAIAIIVLIMIAIGIIISSTYTAAEKEPDLYIRDIFQYEEYVTFYIQNDGGTTYNNITVSITFEEYGSEKFTEILIPILQPYSQQLISTGCNINSSLLGIDFFSNEGYFNLYPVYDNSDEAALGGWVIMIVVIFVMFIVLIAVVAAISQSAKNKQNSYIRSRNNQQSSPFSGFGGQPTQNYTYKNQQTGNVQQPNQMPPSTPPQTNHNDNKRSSWYDGQYKKPTQNNEQQNKADSYQQQKTTTNNSGLFTQNTADSAQGSKSDYYKQLAEQLKQKSQQESALMKQPTNEKSKPISKENPTEIAPASEEWRQIADFYVPEPPKPVQPDMTPVNIESDLLKQAHDGHICKNCGYKANAKKHYCPRCLAPLDDDFTMH